ncbi:MAG: nitrate reductase [Myxococcales bacterium]|nr:nitrate reductase [Myxococcales bacterium]
MDEGTTRRGFLKGTSASLALVLIGCECSGDGTPQTMRGVAIEGREPSSWHASACPYCGVGCGLEVGVADDQVVGVRGMPEHPVNRGRICLLGQNLVGIHGTEDRLLYPSKRVGDRLERLSWEQASSEVAQRLGAIVEAHGPDSIAMYVSASEYIEEYYVYNKFMKGCLGTNNLESSARLCWASGVVGLVKAFGADSPPCAYEDFDHADLFFVAGYNLAASKPVLFRRLMESRARSRAALIVVDPRKTETASRADLHLQIRPGADVALHNAIAHVLFAEGLVKETEARAITENYDALAAHVARFSPAEAASVTGLSAEEIVRAARMIGEADAGLFLWGQGLNQSSIGTRKVTTLLNLVFLTDQIGRPGAGPMAITGQTGAMGLREVGALPHLLPGFRKVSEEEDRQQIAEIWGVDPSRLSAQPGKPIPAILEGIERGEIKALWVIHSNPAATFPDSHWVRSVLERTELLIVQDAYHPTETSRYADYLLPGAQWAEKGGTLTNSERGMSLIEQAVPPPGEARADLEIVMDIGRRMGFERELAYESGEAIFEEYKRCTAGRVNDIQGLSYARMQREPGLQWPIPSADHPGTPRRFVDRRFPKGKVRLNLYEHQEPVEPPDDDYPLVLITGLLGMQYHSRTRTRHIPALARAAPEPRLTIHPEDAARHGVREGAYLRIASRRGSVRARAVLSDEIREGAVFLPYHFGYGAGEDQAVNALTIRAFDESAKQPEYKACAVRIEAAEA